MSPAAPERKKQISTARSARGAIACGAAAGGISGSTVAARACAFGEPFNRPFDGFCARTAIPSLYQCSAGFGTQEVVFDHATPERSLPSLGQGSIGNLERFSGIKKGEARNDSGSPFPNESPSCN